MTGQIDPLFASHPDVVARSEQTRRFVDEFRGQTSVDLDALHQKENEIARLRTALVRVQGVLRTDNSNNVEAVGRAFEIASAALSAS